MEKMENYNDKDGDGFTGIMSQMSLRKLVVLLICICVTPIWLSACNRSSPVPTSSPAMVETTATPAISPEPSSTPVPPTSTPVPLAATVNGEAITLAEYQAEVARYQASVSITGTILASDTYTIVLDELIDQTLLAQGAAENGYLVDDTLIQDRITSLEDQLGGSQALQDWQKAHGYSPDDFTWSLKRSIAAAWMRDQIINQVPETAEEVHVLQILVPTAAQADEAYARLQSGEDFLDVVGDYDPLTKGDLGWFPRGCLKDPKIEAAAFALQPGQYSEVIQTEIGFHILYMLERDEAHTLQPDARRALQEKALLDWINERKAHSEIQVLVP
jgi:peptidyl-prolyl cis-trans isomerase C